MPDKRKGRQLMKKRYHKQITLAIAALMILTVILASPVLANQGQYSKFAEHGEQAFQLPVDKVTIDKKTLEAVITNISDRYIGESPDLGAYEQGDPKPHYGPRRQSESIHTRNAWAFW